MATQLILPTDDLSPLAFAEPEARQGSGGGLPRWETASGQHWAGRLKSPPGRVLVADDRPGKLRVVGAILSKAGLDIVAVPSAAEALERMATCRPELVLIALVKPDLEGFKLCRTIRQNREWDSIPLMICAAGDDRELATRAFANGAADCMANSFNQAELVSRVRAQLSQKTIRDRLKQLAEDKDESLGMLMHNLKNHLVAMNMSAGLLCDGKGLPDAACQRQMLENISVSSGQMLSFVNRFLANASTGHHLAIKLEPVCFSEVAARSVRRFQEAARRKNLVVNASLPVEGTVVHADAHALNQVLDNLLSNAVKFSPPGRPISVAVRPAADYVECQVQDRGNGFTPDDKRKMFRRYRQLSARPTGGEPSAGLGLSIVKKLVEAMRGELFCESNIGSGARFSIRLPRVTAEG